MNTLGKYDIPGTSEHALQYLFMALANKIASPPLLMSYHAWNDHLNLVMLFGNVRCRNGQTGTQCLLSLNNNPLCIRTHLLALVHNLPISTQSVGHPHISVLVVQNQGRLALWCSIKWLSNLKHQRLYFDFLPYVESQNDILATSLPTSHGNHWVFAVHLHVSTSWSEYKINSLSRRYRCHQCNAWMIA